MKKVYLKPQIELEHLGEVFLVSISESSFDDSKILIKRRNYFNFEDECGYVNDEDDEEEEEY